MEQPGEKQPRAAGRTEGKPRRDSKGIRAGSFLSRTGRRRSVTAAKKENCRSQGGRRKMAPDTRQCESAQETAKKRTRKAAVNMGGTAEAFFRPIRGMEEASFFILLLIMKAVRQRSRSRTQPFG